MISTPDITPFQPGSVIQVPSSLELHGFEDLVAAQLSPDMTARAKEAWDGRTQLRNEVRPPKYHGTLADIELHVMDDPLGRITSAGERGFKFANNGSARKSHTDIYAHYTEQGKTMGFIFTATAKSGSSQGVRGQVQAELYYRPANMSKLGQTALVRIMTKPKTEMNDLIEVKDDSQRIALSALRQALAQNLL